MLAEQGAKALDLGAQAAELPGQGWQVRVRGCPLFLTGCRFGEQAPFLVAQRGCLLVFLGVGGGLPLAASLLNLLVQAARARPVAHPLLDG